MSPVNQPGMGLGRGLACCVERHSTTTRAADATTGHFATGRADAAHLLRLHILAAVAVPVLKSVQNGLALTLRACDSVDRARWCRHEATSCTSAHGLTHSACRGCPAP